MHGVLDYLSAVLMLVLPRALNWSDQATLLLTIAGIGVLGASLLTRYELGALRVLPMKAHLALDLLTGALLLGAALALTGEPNAVRATLAVLGVSEIGAALLTQTRSSLEAEPAQA